MSVSLRPPCKQLDSWGETVAEPIRWSPVALMALAISTTSFVCGPLFQTLLLFVSHDRAYEYSAGPVLASLLSILLVLPGFVLSYVAMCGDLEQQRAGRILSWLALLISYISLCYWFDSLALTMRLPYTWTAAGMFMLVAFAFIHVVIMAGESKAGRCLAGGLLCGALVCALVSAQIVESRAQARRMSLSNNLKELGFQMHEAIHLEGMPDSATREAQRQLFQDSRDARRPLGIDAPPANAGPSYWQIED